MAGRIAEAKALFAIKAIASQRSRALRALLRPGKTAFRLQLSGSISAARIDLAYSGALAIERDGTQQVAPSAIELLAAVKRIVMLWEEDETWGALARELIRFRWHELERAELKAISEEVLDRLRRTFPKRGNVRVYLD